jgi:hypothetical protein
MIKQIEANRRNETRKFYKDSAFFNPLPLLLKSLPPGQEDCVFFSGHLNLHAKPETGIPYREKNYNN